MVESQKLGILIIKTSDELNPVISALKKNGYVCFETGNIESALMTLEREFIHMVIFDIPVINKDVVDGLRVLKDKNPEIALVGITDVLEPVDVSKIIQIGLDNILFKPVDNVRFPIIISWTLEKHKFELMRMDYLNDLERKADNSVKELNRTSDLLEQNFIDTIKTFVGLLETRDQKLGSHCKRVATFTRTVTDQFDLKDRVKREIEIGALLHDIGKIGISDQILFKTKDFFSKVQLTNKERSIYQKHPIIGQEAVAMVNVLSNVGSYIRHHHEHFNGSGYPDGLKGFHIPLGARIVHVVDAYDKIVFGVDKQKQNDAEALFLKHLRKQKGIIYDPEATENMISFIREIKSREYAGERRITIDKLMPGMVLARDVYSKSGVLLISQYEKITGNDIERMIRFLNSDMIIDNVYVYGSTEVSGIPSKKATIAEIETSKLETDKSELLLSAVLEAFDSIKDFSILPEIQESVLRFLNDTKSTREDIAYFMKRDSVIALKILRLANSPFFGFARNITTVEDAVSLLGFNEVRHIITTLPVLEKSDYTSDIFNRQAFWKHSVACASISKIIAARIGAKFADIYYTAGLLHDIGKTAVDQLFPDKFRKVVNLAKKQSVFYRKAERMVFGQTHLEIGEYILGKWNIPEVIQDSVKNHHSPMDSKIDSTLASVVHLSDIITHMLHIGESGETTVPKLEGFVEQKLGITLGDLESLIPEIDEEVKQSQELMFRQ